MKCAPLHPLADGADPFQCNSQSLSPMDAAATAGDEALVRAFSEQALFSGPVMFQVCVACFAAKAVGGVGLLV